MIKSRFRKVLILGRLPLPIGGVRIHVERLLGHLEKEKSPPFEFIPLRIRSMMKILIATFRSRVVHLHTSHPWLQLMLSVYCKIFGAKLIITYHGDWGRYGAMRNTAEQLAAFFSTVPLVQTPESLIKALTWNRNAVLLPSFIPPVRTDPVPANIAPYLSAFRRRFPCVFCTHAWNVTFDKEKKETYGISELIHAFQKTGRAGLVISDPSGKYQQYIRRLMIDIPDNIFWISQPHDFVSVLGLSDAFIRNTTTDGTCMSIYEALLKGKAVFASNAVSRPTGCIVYKSITDFDPENEFAKIDTETQRRVQDPGVGARLVALYHRLLNG